jgi:hypothetical protein
MTDVGSFAYGASAVATTDGKELLVYNPDDEAPRWHKTLSANVAHVAVAGEHIIAVDVDGHLAAFRAEDGEEVHSRAVGGPPRALAAHSDVVAVALEDRIVVARGKDTRTIMVAGARAVAFDGERIGIGTDEGSFVVVDEGDARTTEAKIGAPVRGVCRHPRGFWLVSAGDKVHRVDDNGAIDIVTRATGKTPSAITCSGDGRMIGIALDPKTAVAIAYPSCDTILTVSYPERFARKLEFVSGGRFVWIGMDLGDANKIDLDSEDVYRTDPHEGRARNKWLVQVTVAKRARRGGEIPGPKVDAPAPAPKASPKASPKDPPSEPSEEVASTTATLREPRLPPSSIEQTRIVLGVLAVAVAAALLTLKCG